MPALLESPKPASKQEEFVEKQIEHARNRIRALDWLVVGLMLLIGTFAFASALFLIDRYVETPKGTGWAVIGIYLFIALGFLYLVMFRPSRRQINPFYAARRVEENIPDAKNSVVNYVDLKDDAKVPGSVKLAIGVRAAKDLKQVDLNQVIQKRQIVWLIGTAVLFFAGAVVAAVLPPTRTTLAMVNPKGGDATIIQGEDFRVEVDIRGRVPQRTEPDAPRVRLWYNPDDPTTFEDRPLEPAEGRGRFVLTIPAKQVRNGFHYRVMAGNAASADFELKVHIIPQFTGWKVEYEFPEYLQREPEKSDNPNLVGHFNTVVTLTAFTNRPVRSGAIEIEGQAERIQGQLLADNPEAIRFRVPMQRSSHYRIRFITTEGDDNPNPQRYSLLLLDPRPLLLHKYEVTYDYPAYLGAKADTLLDVPQPNLEAMRGTKVTLLARANRPIKEALLQFPGLEKPIAGQLDSKKPMEAKFVLPPMMQDGSYRLSFTPKTAESAAEPESFSIRVITDQAPKVTITKPQQPVIEVPANGYLAVEGIATDDIGLAKINLRMQVVSPKPQQLAPRPYRPGVSFRRESDGTYPTEIAYKDFVELAKIKPEGAGAAGFQLQPGMEFEYWLEAIDTCDVPPGPNSGYSQRLRVKVIDPVANEKKKEKLQQDRQDLQRDQRQHEQKQDQQNNTENRKSNQPQPKGGRQQPQQGERTQGTQQPQEGGPMQPQGMGDMQPMPNQGNPGDQAQAEADIQRIERDFSKNQPPSGAKNKPNDGNTAPKNGGSGDMQPSADDLSSPENFKDLAQKLKSSDPNDRKEAREQLKQMMNQAKKNPPKSDEQQKKASDYRDKLDPMEKQEFDRAADDIQREMQEMNRQERSQQANDKASSSDPKTREQGEKEREDLQREERVQRAADKAMSNDPKTREQGQKELENEMRNQDKQDDVDRQLQNLASGMHDKTKQRQLDDARNLARDKVKKQGPEMAPEPKKDDDIEQLAQKIKNGDRQEKEKAEDELQKKMQDKRQREQVQRQLDDIKNKTQDPQARQNLEQSMEKINDNLAKKDQQPGGEPKPEDLTSPEKFRDLAQKLKSSDEKERNEAKQQLQQMMDQAKKNPPKPEEQQKKVDDYRDKLDPMQKQEFDRAADDIQREMQNMNREERSRQANEKAASSDPKTREQGEKEREGVQREERVQRAADKAMSNDPKMREQGQKELENEMRNQDTRDDVDRQLQGLASGMHDKGKQRQLDDARNLARDNAQKQTSGQNAPPDKKDENDVDRLVKKIKSGAKEEKEQAEKELQKKMEESKAQREQVQKQLEDIKNKTQDPQARKNLEQSIQKIKDGLAKNDATAQPTPKPEDIQKFADKLTSDNKQERQQAQEQLAEAMKQADKDPKASEAARKQLQDVRDKITDPQKQRDFDQAMQKIDQAVQKERQEQAAKAQQQARDEAQKLAADLNSGDKQKQQAAQEKLERDLQDPKKGEALKQELDKLKQNADPMTRQNLEKAEKQAAENIAKKSDAPKDGDLKNMAQKLASGTPEEKKDAQQKLEQMMQDPAKRDQVKQELDKAKEGLTPEQKKDFDKSVQQMQDNVAKKDGPAKKDDVKDLAQKLASGTKDEKKDAQQKLQQMMQDPAKRDQVKQELDKAKEHLTPEQKKDFEQTMEEMQNDVAKKDPPKKNRAKKEDVDDWTKKLQNGSPEEQKTAQEQLEGIMQDPSQREELKQQLDNFKNGLTPEQRKDFDKKVQQMENNVAKKNETPPKKSDVPPPGKSDLDKVVQKLTNGSAEEKKSAQEQIEKMMQDPARREELKQQLDKAKNSMTPEQKKDLDKAVKQMQDNLAKKGSEPKITPQDLENLAKQMQSQKPQDQQQAREKLEEMLRDPAKQAELQKQIDEMRADPKKREQFQKAVDDITKKQLENIADKLQKGTPAEKQQAEQQLQNLMQNLDKQQLDRLADLKDDKARQELERKRKELEEKRAKQDGPPKGDHDPNTQAKKGGDTNNEEAKPGSVPDLKNQLKAGELVLEDFKKKIADKDYQKKLDWTPERIAAFRRNYEQRLAALKKQIEAAEKGQLPPPRPVGGSSLDHGAEKITLDPKSGGPTNAGGKFTAPPGFGDPYRRFTEEVSGSGRVAPK
jgi:collagen type III alpha